MRNTIGILKLMFQGEDDIKQGNVKPQANVFSDVEKRVRQQTKH
jgi:hypothetical protein